MPKLIDVDRLFEATLSTFAERGYQAATTQEIARRADVSEVTLFRRYGSKASLVRAALAAALSTTPFADVVATEDVEADLTALVRAFEATTRSYGGVVVTLLTEVPRHADLQDALSALLPNLENAARVVASHQDRGHLRPGDPWQLLILLIGPLMASGLWARTGIDGVPSPVDPTAIVDAFLDGNRGSGQGRGRASPNGRE